MGNRSSEETLKEKKSEYAERAHDIVSRMEESTAEATATARNIFGLTPRLECTHVPVHKQYFLPPKSPELNEPDYSFLTEQTGKTVEEINQIFKKYGLDKIDAKLNKEEFINVYQELYPESRDHVNDVANQVFHAFDADCTGHISFNEFMVAYALTSHAEMRKKMEYAFELYDFNRTGCLESSELKSIIAGMLDVLGADKKHPNSSELINKTVENIQVTESGRVTREDFITGLMNNQDVRQLMSTF